MKKNQIVIGALLLSIVLLAIFLVRQSSDDVPTAPSIGLNMPLSGGLAFWGTSIQQGMKLAHEIDTRDHPNDLVVLVVEDNAGEVRNALSIMRKLTSVDNVAVVVSSLTPLSKPLRPLALETKTPLLGTVVASLNFGEENSWSFRDYPTPDQLSAYMADFAFNNMNLRRAVSLVVDDEYGRDSQTIFEQQFESLGGSALGGDTMSQQDTDARAQITKLLALDPDTAFLVIRENALGIAVRQFRELGFEGKIIGINAFDSPVVWRTSGESSNGVVFSSALIDYEGNSEAKEFREAFLDRYDSEPYHTHAYGYSIGQYLFNLARLSEGDSVKMGSLLTNMQFNTIRGDLSMSSSRDVLSGVAIYERQDGETVIVERR